MSFRQPADDAATCAICDSDSVRLVRFMLYVKRTVNKQPVTRGAGSILLCSQCWSSAKLDSTAHSRNWRKVAAA